MKSNKLVFFIFLTAFLCFVRPVFADLGISPSDWTEPNGLAGQQITKTFFLSRGDASEDLYFTAQITGDVANWVTIEKGNAFVMPKGQQQFPVTVDLNIPKDIVQKEYKGEIRLDSTSKTAQTGQVGVLLGALIRIDLTISDKPFLSYKIQQIEIPKQEAGNFLNVVLKIENDGNVPAKPTKVTADIFDKFNSTKINSFSLTDFSAVSGVASFSQGNINLRLPIALAPEQYWANISVYQDDKILKTDDLIFNIVKAGAVKNNSNIIVVKDNPLIVPGLILLAVIAAAASILAFKRKPKHKKKTKNADGK